MKCVKCGAELKPGCLYCSVCGHESQILPDYSILEDDYLRSLLREENKPQMEEKREKKTAPKKEMPSFGYRFVLTLLCCIALLGISIGIGVKLYIDNQNANSYEYQMEMGQEEEAAGNDDTAIQYYEAALALQPDDIPARSALTEIYMKQKRYDTALVLCMEIIKLDETNRTAYENLIAIYEEREDYDSILALSEGVTEADILELFQPYLIAPPIVSPLGGDYDGSLVVTLFSLKDYDIYYTLDGTTPDKMNGIYYRGKDITFEEAGDYSIKAVCINEKGISSEVVSEEYHISITPPDMPVVEQDGHGDTAQETELYITAEENCSIYYTWDGSDPTENSQKYTEPILVPEGDWVLSVVAISDKTGLRSEIYRSEFSYHPNPQE